MLNRGWSGKLLCGVLFIMAARVASAQDEASRDEELRDLKRRLEILEKEKQEREAKNNAPPEALLMDPSEDKWTDRVKVGGGIRTSFTSATQGAPNGHNPSTDFALDNARLYVSGKITDWLSATLNTEFTSSPAVLDAIAQFHIANEFNIYTGRLLPATDRSNSDGPFYLSTWAFPALSVGFNAAGTGTNGLRDTGVTFWGDISNFKYWAGMYEGHARTTGQDELLYSARVQYDFMDAETGYYLSSTYYGDKKILAVGLVANYQRNAAGAGVAAGFNKPFGNVAIDFLFEEKLSALGDGTLTAEAAFYYYGRHGLDDTASDVNGAFFTGGNDLGAGTGLLASVAYLIPGHVGWGQFQPHIRYQGFEQTAAGPGNATQWDFGVNYVMSGHNARVSLVYSHIVTRELADKQQGMIVLGTQFQF
jgi:hypothetical protein